MFRERACAARWFSQLCHVWSCTVLNVLMSRMIFFGPVCIYLYFQVWSLILLQSCILLCFLVWSSMVMFDLPVWSCTVLYGLICSGMFIYDFVWSYIAKYEIVWFCSSHTICLTYAAMHDMSLLGRN